MTCSGLFSLCFLFCSWTVAADWISPPPGDSVYGSPWAIGSQHVLEWSYDATHSYTVQLCQENTSDQGVCSTNGGVASVSSMSTAYQNATWTVSPDPFNLETSNLFYFAIQPSGETGISSAYIQLTQSGGGSSSDPSGASGDGGVYGGTTGAPPGSNSAVPPFPSHTSASNGSSTGASGSLSTAPGKPLPTSTILPNPTSSGSPNGTADASASASSLASNSQRSLILGLGIPILLIVLAILATMVAVLRRLRPQHATAAHLPSDTETAAASPPHRSKSQTTAASVAPVTSPPRSEVMASQQMRGSSPDGLDGERLFRNFQTI